MYNIISKHAHDPIILIYLSKGLSKYSFWLVNVTEPSDLKNFASLGTLTHRTYDNICERLKSNYKFLCNCNYVTRNFYFTPLRICNDNDNFSLLWCDVKCDHFECIIFIWQNTGIIPEKYETILKLWAAS